VPEPSGVEAVTAGSPEAAAGVPRPAPRITEDNDGFWRAAAAHRLSAQRCDGCGRLRHPPRPMCPHCRSLDWEWTELAGTGTVYSFTILHHPQHPAFDYPLIAVLVDLDEGPRVLSNLIDTDPTEVGIGMPVHVTFLSLDDEVILPVFRPGAVAS
jgi:uncharacterized OB-fold protein